MHYSIASFDTKRRRDMMSFGEINLLYLLSVSKKTSNYTLKG